jgi:hypothetical protein
MKNNETGCTCGLYGRGGRKIHAGLVGEKKNTYRILLGKLKTNYLEDLGVEGNI